MFRGIVRHGKKIIPFVLVAVMSLSLCAIALAKQEKKPEISSDGIVNTKFGKVKGVESRDKEYSGVIEYRSIPYAAPPIGELRWKAPVDPEK